MVKTEKLVTPEEAAETPEQKEVSEALMGLAAQAEGRAVKDVRFGKRKAPDKETQDAEVEQQIASLKAGITEPSTAPREVTESMHQESQDSDGRSYEELEAEIKKLSNPLKNNIFTRLGSLFSGKKHTTGFVGFLDYVTGIDNQREIKVLEKKSSDAWIAGVEKQKLEMEAATKANREQQDFIARFQKTKLFEPPAPIMEPSKEVGILDRKQDEKKPGGRLDKKN